jgi:hypothetical protein
MRASNLRYFEQRAQPVGVMGITDQAGLDVARAL